MSYLPQYYGSDPLQEPIHEFVRQFKIYCQAKHLRDEEKCQLLDTVIGHPAKREYDAALDPAVPGGITLPLVPNAPNPGDPAAARAAAELAIATAWRARFNNRINWLTHQFHGEIEQQAIRDMIMNLHMTNDESPRQFYQRIATHVQNAGYPDAAVENMIEMAWFKGLPHGIVMHVRSMNTM